MGQSFTLKALAGLGIAIVLFAILLIVIHVNIRTLMILFGIGGGLFALYLYLDYSLTRPIATKAMCKCGLCDHKNEITCLNLDCPCCIIEKDGRREHGVSTLT